MEKETALKILRERHAKALFSERTALETLIPELAGKDTDTGSDVLYEWSLCDEDGNEFASGEVKSPEWVDLGLPSGTLWAACNVGANAPEEYGGYYNWETAMKLANLPTWEQINELIKECFYFWVRKDYYVHGLLFIGPNGKRLFFPASGYYDFEKREGEGICGSFWSRSTYSADFADAADADGGCVYYLRFYSDGHGGDLDLDCFDSYFGRSVREVHKP